MSDAAKRWPTELRLAKGGRTLHVAFDDGAAFELPAEYLRVESPSAEVQGHAAHERRLVHGKREVAIVAVEPVGHYAVRLAFDDLHETGICTWNYLDELGVSHAEKWAAYEAELAAKGLSRQPARRG